MSSRPLCARVLLPVLMGRYLTAVALLVSTLTVAQQTVVLAKFEAGKTLKELGWQGGNVDDGKKDHFLVTEGKETFLRSSYIPGTEAKYLYHEVDWDSEKLPYLRWKWRVNKFPTGAKIMNPKLSDAGAQIYVLWRHFPRYFVLKYFWAVDEPAGSTFKDGNVFMGFLFGNILRSGPPLNEWKTETRNIAEDFEKAFSQKPPGKVRAIAILADGDETNSPSESDYDDIEALSSLQ